jgi:hypothetical protein
MLIFGIKPDFLPWGTIPRSLCFMGLLSKLVLMTSQAIKKTSCDVMMHYMLSEHFAATFESFELV